MSWRVLIAITLTAITVSAYPSQPYEHTTRSNQQLYCPVSELCTWGSCTNITIGLDPSNCGTYGNSCDTGEICVAGECKPLDIGKEKCDTACKPGQWCNDGKCAAIEIAANSRLCGTKQKDCGAGAVCINGECQTLDIDPESKSCGPKNVTCDAGTWCLNDTCTPFILGTYRQACDDKKPCPLGSSCYKGQCQEIFVSTDVYKCGESSKNCTAGQLCVSGSCESLPFTEEKYQTGACGSSDEPCDPGFFCLEDECLPISISIDNSHCGKSSKGCGAYELCISGICIKNLFRKSDTPIAPCTESLSGSNGHSQEANGKGGPAGQGPSGGPYNQGSGKPQYGDGKGNGYYHWSGVGHIGADYGSGSRPGYGSFSRPGSGYGDGGNKGGLSNFGLGRPGPGSDGTGSPSPACNLDCSLNGICIGGECLTVSDPLSCGPSSGLSRRQTLVCPSGFACIDDRCVPVNDPLNCGGSDCPLNYACIDDACVALGDPTNCGDERCGSDAICLGETCTPNPDLASCFGVVCPSGQRCLAGDCIAAEPGLNGNPQGNGGRPGSDGNGNGNGDGGGDADPVDQPSLTITVSGSLTAIPNPDATDGLSASTTGSQAEPEDNERTSTFGVITEGSTTITFPIDPTQTGIACSIDDECTLDFELCIVTDLNVCVCRDAVCIIDPALTPADATDTEGNGPATTEDFPPPPTGTTTCTTDDDCLADGDACLFNDQNICSCIDGICVQQPITGDPQGSGRPGPTDGPDATTLEGPDGEPTATVTLTGGDDTTDGPELTTLDGPDGESTATVTLTDGDGGPDLTTLDGPDGEPTATITLTGGDETTDGPELTTLDGPDGEPTATVTLTEPADTTTGVEVTTLDGPDGEPTATVTLTATEPVATQTEFPCVTDDDCLAQLGVCTTDGLVNLCVCIDAVCILPDLVDPTTTVTDGGDGEPTNTAGSTTTDGVIEPTPTTACETADDCIANAALCLDGLDNICICLNAACVPVPEGDATTTSGVLPTETATISCSSADDCVANVDLCVLLGQNICICVDTVCVPSNGPDDGDDGSACTQDDECTNPGSVCLDSGICGPDPTDPGATACTIADDCRANFDLCIVELINICSCVDAVCVVPGGGGNNGGDGDSCNVDSDCFVLGSECLDSGVCGPPDDTTSCVDANDCLLSADPLCAQGLCVCTNSVCTPSEDVQDCTSDDECSTGASCQNNVCVDDTECTTAADCLANLDICVQPGVCACVDGLCELDGNGPTPQCTVFSDCADLPDCQVGFCLCIGGQCELAG